MTGSTGFWNPKVREIKEAMYRICSVQVIPLGWVRNIPLRIAVAIFPRKVVMSQDLKAPYLAII
jgi:hypothetical protein